MSWADELTTIIETVIRPEAVRVDQSGDYPQRSMDALAAAGVLALTVPREFDGGGESLRAAADVVRRIGQVCGSTAMIVTMHYAATAVLSGTGRADLLAEIGARRHLSTLAFSEASSRSHFWAPVGTATAEAEAIRLDAQKSWVTAAHHADSYVWSSRPLAVGGAMTLWIVRSTQPGLSSPSHYDGMGLRGNDSAPVSAEGVRITSADMLGADGGGLDIALGVALPWFLLLNASASVALMQAVTLSTTEHLTKTRLQHVDQSLAQQLPARMALATMQVETDRTRAFVDDALCAVETGRPDAQLMVLEAKLAGDLSSAAVADLALKTCGGAAFRRELDVERRFRDSRAARVMAPTSDALLDFVGRAMTGLPLLDATQ
jgi:alkylation response protein AidB-like acyl-CoA dehydrogenase